MNPSRTNSLARQIRVVLLSYLTRPGFRWAIVSILSGFSLIGIGVDCGRLLNLHRGEENPFAFLIMIGVMTIMCSLIAAVIIFFAHARQQLMGPATLVMPHTRRANLIVAGALFFAVTLAFCLQGYEDDNFYFPAFFMIALSIMTLIAWAICNPWLIPIPVAALLLATYNNAVQYCIFTTVHDDKWSTLVPRNAMVAEIWKERERNQLALRVILVLANILGLIVLERLSRPRLSSFSPIRVARRIARFWQSAATARPQRRHRFIQSQFARSLHRRYAIHDWRAALFLASVTAAITGLVCYLAGPVTNPVIPIVATLAVLPGTLAAIGWRDRWGSYEYETLYPVKHQQFVSEMLIVLLLDIIEYWLAGLAAMLLTILAVRSQMLHDSMFWTAISGSAMMQVLWIGGIALAGQRRQTLPFTVGLGIAALSMLLSLDNLHRADSTLYPSHFIAFSTIEMVVGFLFLAIATLVWRRRAAA